MTHDYLSDIVILNNTSKIETMKDVKNFTMKGFLYLMHNPYLSNKDERNTLEKEAIAILNWIFDSNKSKPLVGVRSYKIARCIGLPLFLHDNIKRRSSNSIFLREILEYGRDNNPANTSQELEIFTGCGCYDKSLSYFTRYHGSKIEIPRCYSFRTEFQKALEFNQRKYVKELHIVFPLDEGQSIPESIYLMPAAARTAEQFYRQPVTVFHTQGVMPFVKHDSNPKLILRDINRAHGFNNGKLGNLWVRDGVGPYPIKNLTPKQIEKDQGFYDKKMKPLEALWEKESEQEDLENQKETTRIMTVINSAAPMERNEKKWEELTAQSPEPADTIRVMKIFIERHVMLIQHYMKQGKSLRQATKISEKEIDFVYSFSDHFMYFRRYIDKVIIGSWVLGKKFERMRDTDKRDLFTR